MTTVHFYYSLGSRYSYLASTQLGRIARKYGCSFEWHPLNSPALIAARAESPLGRPTSGQYDWEYRRRDAERWAAFYGVPYIEPRNRVTFDSQELALAATAAKRLGHVEVYSRGLYSAMFAEGDVTRIGSDRILETAERCAIPADRFRAELDNPGTAEALAEVMERARVLGIFGVPTFIAGGELFWGNDRLVLLEHHLSTAHSTIVEEIE